MNEWERILERTPAVDGRDLGGALGLLAAHVAPLGVAVPQDWGPLAALAAFSALWPAVRVAGGPVAQWFVGVGNVPQTAALHDELYRTTVASGTPLATVTEGGMTELVAAVQGEQVAALAYYADGGAFVRSVRHSATVTTLATLLASGRDVRGATQPSVAVLTAVSLGDLVVASTRRDWAAGWLGYALLCLPNARRRTPERYPTATERARVAGVLAECVTARVGVTGMAWAGGESKRLAAYAKMLGANDDAPLEADSREPEYPDPLLYVTQAQRIAALVALSDERADARGDAIEVSEWHVEVAVRLVERARGYAYRTADNLGRTRQAEILDKVVNVLGEKGELTAREIYIARRLNEKEAHTALRLLQQDGRVTGRQDGRRYLYRLVRDGA